MCVLILSTRGCVAVAEVFNKFTLAWLHQQKIPDCIKYIPTAAIVQQFITKTERMNNNLIQVDLWKLSMWF